MSLGVRYIQISAPKTQNRQKKKKKKKKKSIRSREK